jgi:hypothetical protein
MEKIMVMSEHGDYSVTLVGRLLHITLSGMFNDLATKIVCQKIQNEVESLNGQDFVILLDCIDYEGSTPAAHQVSNQFLFWLNQQNCLARAIVYSQKLYFDIVKNEQPALFELQNRREFHNLSDAKSWLVAQL